MFFRLVVSGWRLAEWWWITISKNSRDLQKYVTFGANVSNEAHVSQMLWHVFVSRCSFWKTANWSQIELVKLVRVRKKHLPQMNRGILGMARWDAPGDNGAAARCNLPKWWISQLQPRKEKIRSWGLPSLSQLPPRSQAFEFEMFCSNPTCDKSFTLGLTGLRMDWRQLT